MTPLEFGMMFTLGLVSSLHCVPMCGPIVLSYSVALDSIAKAPRSNPFSPALANHLAYNAGRIITYSTLGGVAGFAGQTMGLLAHVAGVSQIIAITSGALMIVVGISMLGFIPSNLLGQSLFRIPYSLMRKVGLLLSAPGPRNRFFLGLVLGFLPCGLIYAALLKAMATGSPSAGAATMLAFALGTAGALLALGVFSSAIRMRVNRWGSQIAAVGVTLLGALLVWRGTMPGMLMMEHHLHAHH